VFSIYICSHNSNLKLLSLVLKGCMRNLFIEKVTVVANGYSNDGLKNLDCFLKLNFSEVNLITSAPGVMNARKTAVLDCRSEWLIFVDDDNILSSRYSSELKAFIDQHSDTVIIGGTNRFPKRLEAQVSKKLDKAKSLLACEEAKASDSLLVKQVPTAGMCIKTTVAKNIAPKLVCVGRVGFDTLSGEDTEICFRAMKFGKIYKSPKLVLLHAIRSNRVHRTYLQKLSREMTITISFLHYVYWNRRFSFLISILMSLLSTLRVFPYIYYDRPKLIEIMRDYKTSVKFMLEHISK
jgi:hypothetical protein